MTRFFVVHGTWEDVKVTVANVKDKEIFAGTCMNVTKTRITKIERSTNNNILLFNWESTHA